MEKFITDRFSLSLIIKAVKIQATLRRKKNRCEARSETLALGFLYSLVIDGQIITEDAHTSFDIGVGNGIAKHSIRLLLTQELMNDLDFLMDLLPTISFILKHIGSNI